jgi:hypothetical protein
MPINIGGGISIGGNVKVTLELPSLVIPLNSDGGVTGWSSTSASIPYSATVIAAYPVGSTITFQDGSTATIVQWDTLDLFTCDIFWNTPQYSQSPTIN